MRAKAQATHKAHPEILDKARRNIRREVHIRGGQKTVESGWAEINLLKAREVTDADPEILRAAGRLGGRKHVESGHLFNMVKKDTKPELAVKAKLDELVALGAISGYVHPFNLNNKFFVDFYVPDTNTIIEVDGCYWHGCEECGYPGRKNDNGRNAYIKACGYNFEIIKEHELQGGTA